jgi:hypothetical protein
VRRVLADPSRKSGSPVRVRSTSPAAFFKELYQTFERAEQLAGGSVNRFYTIGGYVVRLRFAGPALIPFIAPALEHLAVEPGSAPALTVCLWDSVSTRTEMPPPPWSADDYIARGEVRGYSDTDIHTTFHLGSGILNMVDTSLNVALFWICDATSIPYYETGAPLRTILDQWMRGHDRQLAHAAAVGTAEGGVLLAGKGGSGKSTTALTCLSSGLLYAGDDYVLLGGRSTPFVYSLYNSAKLDAEHLQRLPRLLPLVSNSEKLDAEKALIFLHDHHPERVTKGFPVRATLLPRVTGLLDTRVQEASPAESLAALAPSTIFQLPGAGAEAFKYLSAFVRQVPGYVLELGTDLSRIPDVVLGLLRED